MCDITSENGTRRVHAKLCTAWRSYCRGHRPSMPGNVLPLPCNTSALVWRTSENFAGTVLSLPPISSLPPLTTFTIHRGNSDNIRVEDATCPNVYFHARIHRALSDLVHINLFSCMCVNMCVNMFYTYIYISILII